MHLREFITVTSQDSSFQIQERYTAIDSMNCTQASVSTGVAIKDIHTPIIQVSTPRVVGQSSLNTVNSCPIDFYVSGAATALESFSDAQVEATISNSNEIVIVHKDTNLRVLIQVRTSSNFGCHLFVQPVFPGSFRPGETILGLLGTPNGDT